MPSDISESSIQNAILALGSIKARIYDKGVGIQPRVVGVYNTLGGDSTFINSLISSGTSLHQLKRMAETLDPTLIPLFVLKNLLFGIIIASTACYHGFRARRSPTELPQQTQRAIVTSLVLVFAADGLLAVVS